LCFKFPNSRSTAERATVEAAALVARMGAGFTRDAQRDARARLRQHAGMTPDSPAFSGSR
jgi:hypothetical protein